ncbi:hypothetical protein V5799_025340 [Amblyomma americanum]|uniref:Uncharacterized protein n=1 Tax=Amblyomma americanum TaxID=6943 RepID=A0AAQ4E9J5_AMBAM
MTMQQKVLMCGCSCGTLKTTATCGSQCQGEAASEWKMESLLQMELSLGNRVTPGGHHPFAKRDRLGTRALCTLDRAHH